jgi:L-2-hydroxyglutarate oxidase
MTRPTTDFTVIGAGIVGLATAYALTRAAPGATLTVIEKESGPARHQTGRNSGVIHSGIYYRPGTLKARYALAGSAETPKFAAEHGIPYEITGKLIVATAPAELPRLHALVQRGREHGLTVRELGPAQIAAYEPEVAGPGRHPRRLHRHLRLRRAHRDPRPAGDGGRRHDPLRGTGHRDRADRGR